MVHFAFPAPLTASVRVATGALLVVGALILAGCDFLLVGKDACVSQRDCYSPFICENQRCVVAIGAPLLSDGGSLDAGDLDGGVPAADAGIADSGVDAGRRDAGNVDFPDANEGAFDGGGTDSGIVGGEADSGIVDGGTACEDATCDDWRLYQPCDTGDDCGAALQCAAFDLYLLNRICAPSCNPTSVVTPRGGCPNDPQRGVWCLTASSIGDDRVEEICVAHPDAQDARVIDAVSGTTQFLALTGATPVQSIALIVQSGPLPVTVTVTPSPSLDVVVKTTTGSGLPLQSCDDGLEGEEEVCGLVLDGPARHHLRIEGFDGTLGDFQLTVTAP